MARVTFMVFYEETQGADTQDGRRKIRRHPSRQSSLRDANAYWQHRNTTNVIVGISLRFRRNSSPRSHPAKVIFPCSDDDRPPDDGVGPDKPHHSVFQVHLAHASIVRVYVPCVAWRAGRHTERNNVVVDVTVVVFGVSAVPSGGVREMRREEARRGLLLGSWKERPGVAQLLLDFVLYPLTPHLVRRKCNYYGQKNTHFQLINFSSCVSTWASSTSALLFLLLLPSTSTHFTFPPFLVLQQAQAPSCSGRLPGKKNEPTL